MIKAVQNRNQELANKIRELLGLNFSDASYKDLHRGLTHAAADFGFQDFDRFADWLLSASLRKSDILKLAKHLTIGETYFFRDKKVFHTLKESGIRQFLQSRPGQKGLRIWSAGCSSGEEAYSIAIMLDRSIGDTESRDVKILATDINPTALQKAQKGCYSNWSFRDTPKSIIDNYFQKIGDNKYRIAPHLQKRVTFRTLNLATNEYPSFVNDTTDMDVIFCRNVLMYFSHDTAQKIIRRFHKALNKDGWLILAPVETSLIPDELFARIGDPEVAIYRKKSAAQTMLVGIAASIRSANARPDVSASALPASAKAGSVKVSKKKPGSQRQTAAPRTNRRRSNYERALHFYQSGQYNRAVELLENKAGNMAGGYKSDQERAREYALLARIYANQGKLEEAYQWCEKALKTDKLNPSLHYLYATIVQELGQTEEAIASLRKAIYLDPNFVIAHFALGNLLKQSGAGREGSKSYSNVLTLIQAMHDEEIIPESGGMTVKSVANIIKTIL